MHVIFLDMDGVLNSEIEIKNWKKEHGNSDESFKLFKQK